MEYEKKIVQRYELVRILNQGAFAVTYLAKDLESSGRLLNLKIFQKGFSPDPKAFRQNWDQLQLLRHPNLLRLIEWGQEGEVLFYSTEHVEGRGLIQEAAVQEWGIVFQLMVQAAWALGELHEGGIVHGALKPESLLVLKISGNSLEKIPDRLHLKLTDFGLSLGPNLPQEAWADCRPYWAPELLAGDQPDPRADLYSLGLIFYQMALGKLPGAEAWEKGGLDLEMLRESAVPPGVIQCIEKEALAFAEPWIPQVYQWTNPALVADFLATLIYLLSELGRLAEAQSLLLKLHEHPALKSRPNLEYYLTGAYLSFRQGRRREAKTFLHSTPEELLNQAPAIKRARFENYKGLSCQAEKDFVQAALHFERAADFAHEAKRRDQEMTFSVNAAALYGDQGRWAKAYQLYQSALNLARELTQRKTEASILNRLGQLYLHFGRWHEAEGSLIRSLDLGRQEEMPSLVADNLYLMTVAEEGRGNPEKTEDYLRQALVQAKDLGEKAVIIRALLARANFEFSQGRQEAREASLREIQRYEAEAGESPHGLQVEWLCAKQAVSQGNILPTWVAATYEKIREEAAGRADTIILWQIHTDIGDLERLQGRLEEAEASYHRAQEILSELLPEVPEPYRDSFLRDRKKQRITEGLEAIAKAKAIPRPAVATADGTLPSGSSGAMVVFEKWRSLQSRMLQQSSTQALLEETLTVALRFTDAESGFVALDQQGQLEMRATRRLDPTIWDREEMRFGRRIAEEVLRQSASQIIYDAPPNEDGSHAASRATPLRSLLCVPLRAGSRALGVLYLENRHRQGVFQAEHLPWLEALADQATLALGHTETREEMERSLEELRQSKASVERQLQAVPNGDFQDPESRGLDPQIADLEKKAILYALEKVGGNKVKAAQMLKISRRTLYLKIEQFGIPPKFGKNPSPTPT
ncbi:MAG: GAF domain-containing protein [Deltaproteobacteria bacterium]|nr:GAF domain-containing protein [Deltaproteobacteria bacterium]